jgi:hypothetical protein
MHLAIHNGSCYDFSTERTDVRTRPALKASPQMPQESPPEDGVMEYQR